MLNAEDANPYQAPEAMARPETEAPTRRRFQGRFIPAVLCAVLGAIPFGVTLISLLLFVVSVIGEHGWGPLLSSGLIQGTVLYNLGGSPADRRGLGWLRW
ncbi:hypothetical protein BH23PLA1_BH23PLA1_04310 [soil metagenome]